MSRTASVHNARRGGNHLLVPSAQLVEHWQNLAGEEVEQTSDYSYEELHEADVYAHEHSDFLEGPNF